MIGLGSNRLTVCRRGGMSVTQAGRGGMEWLAGGRMPSWASPYSAQATAALLAQFPTQWPTIRDYGFAHPEIVGYMNAYAPEDAKIAYSLVPTLGKVRLLVNSNNAYIDTGVAATDISLVSVDIDFTVINVAPSDASWVFGTLNQTTPVRQFTINNNLNRLVRCTVRNDGGAGSIQTDAQAIAGKLYRVRDYKLNECTINGVRYTFEQSNFSLGGVNFGLFACIRNSQITYGNNGIGATDIKNGNQRTYFIPFKLGVARSADQVYPSSKGAQAVGTLGMLDLVTGLFHPNANSSGSFTISETPAS